MGVVLTVVIIVAIIVGFFVFLYYFPFGLWIRTLAAGVPLSMISLIRMRLIGIQRASSSTTSCERAKPVCR